MNGPQLTFAGMEEWGSKPIWTPRQCVLEAVKQYFLGYAAHDRQIFARRKHIAVKLGMSVRNLARYLKHLAEAGWIVTTRRKVRTAIRSVLHVVMDASVPSYVPSSKGTADEHTLAIEVLSTPQVYLETDAGGEIQPHQQPESQALTVPAVKADRFEEYIGVFMAARKPLTENRIMIACRNWISIEPTSREQQTLVDTAFRTCRDASEPRYIPDPSTFLRRRRDGALDLPTVLPGPPDIKPESKLDKIMRGALAILKQRGGQ